MKRNNQNMLLIIAVLSLFISVLTFMFGNNILNRLHSKDAISSEPQTEETTSKDKKEISPKEISTKPYQQEEQPSLNSTVGKEQLPPNRSSVKEDIEGLKSITTQPDKNILKSVDQNPTAHGPCSYRINSKTRTHIPIFRAANKNSEIVFKLAHFNAIELHDSVQFGRDNIMYRITSGSEYGWVEKKNIKLDCN